MTGIGTTRDVFLWCMSVIYVFAFASLYVQIPGLYGENGILPVKSVVHKEADTIEDLLSDQPTLMRLLPKLGLDTETTLDLICLCGLVLSFVAMICKHQRSSIVFALLWVFYFSLFQVGQTFLWFQWDILLLEAGFLTVLVAPLNLFGLRSTWYHEHDHVTLWLIKWLLFRLMFASGVVKLTSNCPTWWGLTALNHHYETQCIPTPVAWYLHQCPEWFQKLSVVIVYVIEIATPFLFFSPIRSQRIFAYYAQVFFQLLIIVSGNYNFFNLTTLTLCIALLDDDFFRHWMRRARHTGLDTAHKRPQSQPPGSSNNKIINLLLTSATWILNGIVFGGLLYFTVLMFSLKLSWDPFKIESQITFTSVDLNKFLDIIVPLSIWIGAVSFLVTILRSFYRCIVSKKGFMYKSWNLSGCLFFTILASLMFSISLVPHTMVDRSAQNKLPKEIRTLHAIVTPYRITSPYGLFRRMTGVDGRPEVVIEGSNSVNGPWKEYNFLYKPGNVSVILPIVAPHQPRLDWQMWFAALGTYQHNPWFVNLVYRLLNNQREVLELMGDNPFPKSPPKYIRATLYHYYYTRLDKSHDWHSDSDWWIRKRVKEYLPIVSKDEPSFVNYLKQAGIHTDKKTSKETDKSSNALKLAVTSIRSLIGQANGFRTCLTLLTTGLVLTVFDPTVKFFRDPFSSNAI